MTHTYHIANGKNLFDTTTIELQAASILDARKKAIEQELVTADEIDSKVVVIYTNNPQQKQKDAELKQSEIDAQLSAIPNLGVFSID